MQEKINIEVKKEFSIEIFENSSLFLKQRFDKFNIDDLVLDIFGLLDTDDSEFFDIRFSFSYDNISWSNKCKKSDWNYNNEETISHNNTPIFICIFFDKIENDIANNEIAIKLKETKTERNTEFLILNGISYKDKKIDISCEDSVKFVVKTQIINKYPKWNFYNNQNATVERWLKQCESIVQMYGHVCVYFKTDVTETNETLANNYERDVVSIKKQLIISPNNELPQDNSVYERENDWTLEGDFIVQVVDSLFKNSFGENAFPMVKDYLYFPIVNKLFRVNSAIPKNGLMGVVGFWNLALVKFEDDESINISDNIKDIYSVYNDFHDGIEMFGDNSNVINEFNDFNQDTKITKEKIDEKTIEEKKEATGNFTNRLIDSTSYIDVKETDKQRTFYEKRLTIISVNPDNSSFPVMMYDCSAVTKRTIALTYDLVDLTSVNKFKKVVESFEFSYDFVLTEKFVGEIFDIIGFSENPLVTISIDRRKNKNINFSSFQYDLKFDYDFEINEYYKIVVNFVAETNILTVKIHMLENGLKVLKYQDLKIVNTSFKNPIEFKKLYLYGGKTFVGKVSLKINNEKIIFDECKPILEINNKGRN